MLADANEMGKGEIVKDAGPLYPVPFATLCTRLRATVPPAKANRFPIMQKSHGISGLSLYVPPYRVNLREWCDWTGNPWDKIRNVVGHSFRMRGPDQSVYTMAANAVLGLIGHYAIDPTKVGFLGLGTESSTDNSAGAVIVRGLVDQALDARGQAPLSRNCEVPEFKHACLGGVYGLKGAIRYLALDGAGRQAIVVSADIAEYARSSSGEPTQGAGAVAMLLEQEPAMLEVDLSGAFSASDYRGLDFRKPFLRYTGQAAGVNGQIPDLPVFNGKYSTTCYVDETLHALDAMLSQRGGNRSDFYRRLRAVFMHRPYHRMPATAWALGYLFALAHEGESGHGELAGYCRMAQLNVDDVLAEMATSPRVAAQVAAGDLAADTYPLSMLLLKVFRKTDTYQEVVADKMRLGSDAMMDLGNLYTAALPAWIAAGMEDGAERGLDLANQEIMLCGYGSGDAAEVIPMRVAPRWREAAGRIRFRQALEGAVDLSRTQYEALHGGTAAAGLPAPAGGQLVVDHVGESREPHFQDYGIEYYRFVS
jgi:hydroxymethylglutaryl-CoA synthase